MKFTSCGVDGERMAKTIYRQCIVCTDDFFTDASQIRAGKGKCCSLSCAASLSAKNRDSFGDKNPNWKGGIRPKEKGRKYRARYPLKEKAHQAIRKALTNKVALRQPCERCGIKKTHAHHEDYSKPLNIMWLCKQHHLQRHRELSRKPVSSPAMR